MALTPINRGSSAGDGTGEQPYTAFGKVNANEAYLEGLADAAQADADTALANAATADGKAVAAQATADAAIPSAQKAAANGVASLDAATRVPVAQLVNAPSGNIVFDPFNRRLDPGDNFDGNTRWFDPAAITVVTGDTNNPYGTRTFRFDGSKVYVGKDVWLTDAGIRVGDTVEFKARIRRASGSVSLALIGYTAAGGNLGPLISPSSTGVTGNGTVQTVRASGIVEAGTAYIAVLLYRTGGTDDTDVYAMWGRVNAAAPDEPDHDEPTWFYLAGGDAETDIPVARLGNAPAGNIVFDPFFRRVDPLVDFDGRDRWFGVASQMEMLSPDAANPYGTRTYVIKEGAIYVGKQVWLDDAGIKDGDAVSFKAKVRILGAERMNIALFAYTAAGGSLGQFGSGPQLIGDGNVQTVEASGTVPAGTGYIAVLYNPRYRNQGDIHVYATWGRVHTGAPDEPDFSEPVWFYLPVEDGSGGEGYTEVTVAAAGGDYTTVTAALAAITDASATNRYRIFVNPGTYTEVGASGNGLELKSYVDVHGAGRDLVTLKGPNVALASVIHYPANCEVTGMTLQAAAADKYCIHLDWGVGTFADFTARDLRCIHDGGGFTIGIGARPGGQTMLFEDVEMLGSAWAHSTYSGRAGDLTDSWSITFRGCTMDSFLYLSLVEYFPSVLTFDGCEIRDYFRYQVGLTYYTANPGNPLYNRGYPADGTAIVMSGTHAGRLEMGTGWDEVRDTPQEMPNISQRVVNAGAGAIAAGQAVKLLVNPGTDPISGNQMHSSNVAAWDGSGIYLGVAVTAIAVGARGAVQLGDRPLVSADGTTAIAYGDALELNASGVFVKRTAGIIRGHALAALPSGTGLIAMLSP